MGRLGSRIPSVGVTTLSDLKIDVDKDWKAHGIYNLGDLTPKVDGAYNIGSSAVQFDTVYAKAGPPPGADSVGREQLKEPAVDSAYLFDNAVTSPKMASDSIYKRHLRTGVVDTSYLADNAATAAKVDPSVDLEFVRSNDNVIAGDIDVKVDGAYNLGSPTAKFGMAYATSFPGMADLIYKTTPEVADVIYTTPTDAVPAGLLGGWSLPFSADVAYQPELQPVKFAGVFDHGNLSSDRAKDIVYHANFNLPSPEARDKVAESAYGMAGDLVGVKGISKQVTQKRDFTFRTETPNHAYWHRMYNTPAAFEAVYQDYTTSMQKKGTTPSKSAPNTADPNPQPGACWSVSILPDGTQIGGFASPAPDPRSMAWDGTYLWLSDSSAVYIYQLKTDGTQVGGFVPPTSTPRGAAWDGEYIWYSDSLVNWIYQLKTDGTQVTSFASPAPSPRDVFWDGEYLWNTDFDANYIYQLKADGTQVGGFAAPTGSPTGLTWDGIYFWNVSTGGNYIYQLKADGTQVGGFASPATGPIGVAWDGTYLWHSDGNALYVYQLGNAGNLDVNYRIFAK